MGIGDHLMAVGDAWRAHRADPLRRKVALGDGRRLYPPLSLLCHGLEFLATPDDLLRSTPLNWVANYPGHRPYLAIDAMRAEAIECDLMYWRTRLGFKPPLRHLLQRQWNRRKVGAIVNRTGRYRFNSSYRPHPAPVQLNTAELKYAAPLAARSLVVIEPYIKANAPPSKQWPIERFRETAHMLAGHHTVVQLSAPEQPLLDPGIPRLETPSFREALAVLSVAQLYIGPEGGLHHGAAAMGTPSIVIYGGFTSPAILGYEGQIALTGNAGFACGTRFGVCPHCHTALERITVAEVVKQAETLLLRGRQPYVPYNEARLKD
jgi:hypothetical protein